jgi:2-methylisocitrate lyase-like PEP mutase family enzyme
MKATTRLRQLIADPEILVAPGAYDGITARLIEQAGFSALYMTGAAPRRPLACRITAC